MSINVLVVDDDETFAEIVARHIKTNAKEVVTAFVSSSFEDAIKTAKKKKFDVFIIDEKLGKAVENNDGILLLAELKQICPAADAIVFTGFPDNPERVFELGVYRYMSKINIGEFDPEIL